MSKRPFETEEEEEEQQRRNQKMVIRVTRSSSVFFTKNGDGGSNCCCCCCQVEECERDLSEAKQYYKRHRVCEQHAKATVVLFKGNLQRFCQQCSKFHALSEFDDEKRSCRERLASHNERRRLRNAVQEQRAKGGGATKLIAEKTCKNLL